VEKPLFYGIRNYGDTATKSIRVVVIVSVVKDEVCGRDLTAGTGDAGGLWRE
jgi:hypothetical protein